MKDYKLSEIKAMCKDEKCKCSKCKIKDWCFENMKHLPITWQIDKEQPKNRVDTLEDTIDLMKSADYKERFEAEYYQLKIRRDKLQKMWDNWDILQFNPTCKKEVYTAQLTAMNIYLDVLKQRAEIEGIELNK